MDLLKELLNIKGVSGYEDNIRNFILNKISSEKNSWKKIPTVYSGRGFQDCILLKFGNPRCALFAHMDTVGFMSRYDNQLITIGSPEPIDGSILTGSDRLGPIECKLLVRGDSLFHDFGRPILPGTCLSFSQKIHFDGISLEAAYLDNRLGVFTALEVCRNLEDGWVVFTTYEEHGGGSIPFLLRFIQENHPVYQALIADVTWVSEGVIPNNGVAISLRDRFIPRGKFIDKIVNFARQSKVKFQLEVEDSGASDGREIHYSPYPIDWCLVGCPIENIHSPFEKVSLADLDAMIAMNQYLMQNL